MPDETPGETRPGRERGSTGFRSLVSFAVAALAIAACNADLTQGAACPILCPQQNVQVRDTVFEAVSLDTMLVGIPSIGRETALLLSKRGDSLDTRVILRFDSLITRVVIAGGDSAIRAIDSAYIQLVVNAADTRVRAPIRIDLFDVDTVAGDTTTAAVLALFRPDRLIGGTSLDTNQVRDSVRVFLDNAKLLPKITSRSRLRVGLRLTSAQSASVSIGATDAGQGAILRYDPAPADTAIKAVTVTLRSDTPEGQTQLPFDLFDYVVYAAVPPAPPPGVFAIGGLPARRSFLRFDVPARLLDSSVVLRATLLLTQAPNRGLDATDSILILPQLVLAGEEVTDLTRAATLLSLSPVDTVRLAPGDSGLRPIEMVAAVSSWSVAVNPFRQQRAIVLRSTVEGTDPFEAWFFSREADPAVRPRLRISYALRSTFGIP
ncbi:MAG: hypothetical protein ACT4OZ_09665 [Gemmatimonadota bacterium]